MIGGFGFLNKPKPPPGSKRISINVDGKRVLELDEPTNLRRVLQANKIDVYPLRGKLSNW